MAVSYPAFFDDLDRLARRDGAPEQRVKTDKIYLVGFMGAGKSSVARALGKRLDWKVEDIDARIERAERRDIPTIFRDSGEPYFRAREREALIDLLPERGAVVASGGGTFADASNRELMLRDGGGRLARCAVRNRPAARAPRRPPAAGCGSAGHGTAL